MTEQETDGLIRRTFSAELTSGDGRTVDCRIVPYGEQIQHDDGLGGVPKGMPYTEEWAPGAFQHQERAANRVLANVEHEQGVLGIVGHGLALRETPDGLYGSFRLHETAAGETALTLIREGVLDTVSLEARPQKSVKGVDGVVRRVKAHLQAIAFTRFGAYTNATILALREEATFTEETIPEELLPVAMDPATVERIRRLGLELPDRYKAHPDENGHPGQTGTPEDGTRPSVQAATSEDNNEHNPVGA